MNRTGFHGIALGALLLSAIGFSANAFASCSSYISGSNEATVTCTAATDALIITQAVVGGGVYWLHLGPSSWGTAAFWDGSGAGVSAGGTIRIAGLNGGSVTIGDQTYTPADALNGKVILNSGSGGGEIIFDASVSGAASSWYVNDGATPFATWVNSLTFTNNGSAYLTINTGTANNLVNVWSVYGSDTLDVVGHGNNEVDVGNSTNGSARAIYGAVHIFNPCCYTTLNFHDWNDATGRAVTYTESSVSGLAPVDIGWSKPDVSAITLYMGTGADSVNVTSTYSPLTIHSTNGADVVNIGNAGNVQGINGAIAIDNPPNYTDIIINDSADATARVATLTDSGITGITPAAINWVAADTGAITLLMGTAADTVNVLSTKPAVTIQGSNGHDTVNVGNGGSVQGILGALDVRNFSSRTALNIDDWADSTGRTATYTKTGITGLTPAAITWPENDVSAVTLDMGVGADTVNVLSVYSGSGDPLTIHGSNGLDSVYFGDASGNAQQILTPVMVDNSASYTAVFVDDSADTTGRNVAYSKTGISGVAPGHIGWASNDVGSVRLYLGSGSDVVHVVSSNRNVSGRSFINQIDLGGGNNQCYVTGSGLGTASANSIYANAGDDQFVISAVPTSVASVNVYGGSQAAGDELVYTGGPATGAFPGNGTLTPTDINAHAINYNSIESFSINDVIFRDGFQ